jgi:oligopeptidase A
MTIATAPRRITHENEEANNPLLDSSGLPHFESIQPEHVEPAILQILDVLHTDFQRSEEQLPTGLTTYASVLEGLEKLKFPLTYSWNIVSLLNDVKNSEKLRDAYQTLRPKVVNQLAAMGQSRIVYDALKKLESEELTEAQRRVVEAKLCSMRQTGVELQGEAKAEFNDILMKLVGLSTNFSNNVLDATKAFELVLTDSTDVAGLPASALQLAAQSYAGAYSDSSPPTPEAGPWRLTLDAPSFDPAMKFLKSSKLREQMYRAYITRASTGELDNGPIVAETLKLRLRGAQILGFPTFAQHSTSEKMAGNVEAVDKLIAKLFEKARPAAEREMTELGEFAASKGYEGNLKLWDVTYWSERLKEEKYAYDEEALRPYFALPKVLDGMFGIAVKLFGIDIIRNDAGAERWHPDVMFFDIFDHESQEKIASFFLDPYARPSEKQDGAWMQACTGRSRALGTKPVAYLICNGSPPVGDEPSLMTLEDAQMLFHEFGHGLQHMLTHVEEGDAAGSSNIEFDAVELPSQFMENWLYHKPTLDSFAVHYKTGEPLPSDVFDKITGVRTFMAGYYMLRQLQIAALDMELHARYHPQDQHNFDEVLAVHRRIANQYSVLPALDDDRFLCSFAHIFAGGYAAGYYSYLWAEVLSADAFAAFEEAGLDDAVALAMIGRHFRETVLGSGGSRAPSAVYRDFRGRDATVDALLRHRGLP